MLKILEKPTWLMSVAYLQLVFGGVKGLYFR